MAILAEAGLRIARMLVAVRLRGSRAGPEAVVVGSIARGSFVRVDRPAVSVIVLAAGSGSRMASRSFF